MARMDGRVVGLALGFLALASCSRGGSSEAQAGESAASASAASVASSEAKPSRLGSCDRVTKMSVCSEYAEPYLGRNEPVLTGMCSKLGGVFAYAECPNTSVLGTCKLATSEVRKYYASGGAPYDASRAKTECESSYRGMWAAFP